MSCTDIRKILVLYIKNELQEAERIHVANHLRNCKECAKEETELKEMDHLLSSNMRLESAPVIFMKTHSRRVWQYALSAAVIILIIAVLWIRSADLKSDNKVYLAWETQSSLDQIEFDYYRLEYDVLFNNQNSDQLIQDDTITDYIEDLNSRIDYLEGMTY